MASDATHPDLESRFVGYGGNVLVALDAEPLAVDALAETLARDVQRARLAVRARRRKPCVAVTPQAGIVLQYLRRALRGR